ncbi:MAG: hypothetical protein CL840_15995 [Crocinitomicaceae bacterium]|jgi:hypothetical protein|nr:hypothetical protein [Crocinitomicaceae bacterium]|tara:strand:+ start:230 stop:469 length:240 start_codon:yes stop_codon:yes gene_type:complete
MATEPRYDIKQLKADHENGDGLSYDEVDFLFELLEAGDRKEMAEIMVLSEIREAVGDNGKMMQSELVEHIKGLAGKAKQ